MDFVSRKRAFHLDKTQILECNGLRGEVVTLGPNWRGADIPPKAELRALEIEFRSKRIARSPRIDNPLAP